MLIRAFLEGFRGEEPPKARPLSPEEAWVRREKKALTDALYAEALDAYWVAQKDRETLLRAGSKGVVLEVLFLLKTLTAAGLLPGLTYTFTGFEVQDEVTLKVATAGASSQERRLLTSFTAVAGERQVVGYTICEELASLWWDLHRANEAASASS